MSCLSAEAKIARDLTDIGASIDREDVSASAIVERDNVEIKAEFDRELVSVGADLEKEELSVEVNLKRESISVGASVVCSIGIDNSLWASDGVLYDGNSQPIFVTEKWES